MAPGEGLFAATRSPRGQSRTARSGDPAAIESSREHGERLTKRRWRSLAPRRPEGARPAAGGVPPVRFRQGEKWVGLRAAGVVGTVGEFGDRYGTWALIAGASEGVGLAFARALAERQVNVVLLSRRQSVLDEAAADLQTTWGIATRSVAIDLSEARCCGDHRRADRGPRGRPVHLLRRGRP